jgi:hypothetical protein
MKLSSQALQTFLANLINNVGEPLSPTITPGTIFTCDLYCFVTGSGRIALNQQYTTTGSVTVVPPQNGTFVMDLGVREVMPSTNPNVSLITANPLTPVSSSPASGQYSVNDEGTYEFFSGESGTKLISFVYQIGLEYNLPAPSIIQVCDADVNVTYQGQTYWAGGVVNKNGATLPAIQRSKITTKLGLETSTIDIQIYANPNVQLGTNPLLAYITQGLMDGASVLIQRGFSSTDNFAGVASMGTLIAFSGTVAPTKTSRTAATITVKSKMELLDQQMPRVLHQPGCQNVLFDQLCTLNSADYSFSGSVISVNSGTGAITTTLTQPGALATNPTASPNVTGQTGGQNLTPAVYYAAYTWIDQYGGESLISPQGAYNTDSNNNVWPVCSIAGLDPGPPEGVVYWNCYMGFSPGDYNLQNATPIPIDVTTFPSGSTTPQNLKNGIVESGTTPPIFPTTGYFSQGVMTFTSGANAGLSRVVANYDTGGILTVVPQFPNAIAEGDEFVAVAGCSKTSTQCYAKFNNLLNFAGFPYIPIPASGF